MGFQFIKEKVHFLNMIRTEKILKYFFSVEYFFKDLFSLEILDLKYNNIHKIDSKAFDGLNRLQELDLRSNKITEIGKRAYECLTNLIKLNAEPVIRKDTHST